MPCLDQRPSRPPSRPPTPIPSPIPPARSHPPASVPTPHTPIPLPPPGQAVRRTCPMRSQTYLPAVMTSTGISCLVGWSDPDAMMVVPGESQLFSSTVEEPGVCVKMTLDLLHSSLAEPTTWNSQPSSCARRDGGQVGQLDLGSGPHSWVVQPPASGGDGCSSTWGSSCGATGRILLPTGTRSPGRRRDVARRHSASSSRQRRGSLGRAGAPFSSPRKRTWTWPRRVRRQTRRTQGGRQRWRAPSTWRWRRSR
eukprot:scaffold1112_cov116-Isochrysis_galbana.AAC.51